MDAPAPPFNPLHVFAVAARHGNLTRAAAALGVSQSAVSRQVAVLEGWMGTLLFRRERHGIVLTEEGEALFAEVGPAFARIAAATARLRRAAKANPVRIRLYSTFAAKWLIPRLHRFEAQHPGVRLRLSHSTAPVDFRRDAVDLAVQLGDGRWNGLHARRLMPDLLQPVCAPRLAPKLRRVEDLRGQRLLVSRYRRDDWRDWLSAAGHPELWEEGLEFTSSVLTFQAAAEGLGVAIGQMRLLEADIAAGLLVPLFQPVERRLAYHAVWPKDRPLDHRGRAFLAWLVEEARG